MTYLIINHLQKIVRTQVEQQFSSEVSVATTTTSLKSCTSLRPSTDNGPRWRPASRSEGTTMRPFWFRMRLSLANNFDISLNKTCKYVHFISFFRNKQLRIVFQINLTHIFMYNEKEKCVYWHWTLSQTSKHW